MSQLTEELLSRVDIVDVIGKYMPLKRSGSNFSGNCPFHNEKTPSFMVSPQKQIFKCFGCGKGWNALTFVQEIERLDFRDAVKHMAKDAHFDLTQYDQKKIEEYTDQKEKIKYIHRLAQQYFVSELGKNDTAMSYFKDKRHLDTDIIQQFGLGYVPDQHYGLIQYLKGKGFSEEDMIEASLAKKGNTGDVYSFFRNRLTFPIWDMMGNVIAFGARALGANDQPKYLNSADHKAYDKSKTLYGLNFLKQAISSYNYVVVVEWYMDVIALHRMGIPVAVATCGTSLTEEHMKMLKRYTDTVYFLFDNDEAGYQAAMRALKIAYKFDLFPKIIQLPKEAKDIDDIANREDGKELFTWYLKEAKDAFLAVFERLRASSDFSSPIDKQKVFSTLFGLLTGLQNPSVQMHYLQLLGEKVGVAYEVLEAQYRKYIASEGKFLLQQRQKATETKPYQPERDMLYASLLVGDFLSKYIQEPQLWDGFLMLSKKIQEIGESLPLHTLLQSFSDPAQQKLFDEAQLWREYHFQEIIDEDKKVTFMLQVLWPLIQQYITLLLKLPSLAHEQKQELLSLKTKIRG